MAGLAGHLDERLDQIAIEEQKLFPVRIFLTLAAGGVLAAHVDFGVAVLCVSVILACELFERIVTRPLVRGGAPNTLDRFLYLLAITAISGAWLMPYIFWWTTGQKSLQFIAILSLNAQMIHVQAFMFRSPLALAIGTALPAITLLVLLIGYSDFSGLELVSVTLACNSTIGYVLYSAHLNIVSKRMIEQSRSAFQYLANTDPLTGIPNRRRFTELLREAISNAERGGGQFSLLLVDLDKFKSINDTVGHDAGDAVLVEAAERLRQAVGENGSPARLGGDEFGILLHVPAKRVPAICDRIVAAFQLPIPFAGQMLRTAPSIGVASFPEDASSDEALFKCADLALYDAKHAGGSGWAWSAAARRPHIVDVRSGGTAA